MGDLGTIPIRGNASIRQHLIVLAVAAAVFLGCMVSPPSLMDDVDAVQGQIARNMLDSGDWVTARLDGVAYLEKAPLKYWMMAVAFKLCGVHDWVSRLPVALAAVSLCWLTFSICASFLPFIPGFSAANATIWRSLAVTKMCANPDDFTGQPASINQG